MLLPMPLHRSPRRGAGAAAAALVLGIASAAHANGRYPAAGQIALDPMNEANLLVRATYGIMISTTAGRQWGWVCEPAVGYGNIEDPMMAYTANGTILAGIFEGLSIGVPSGCDWTFAPGGLLNKYVIDLAVDKVDPTKAVLIISNSVGQNDAGSPIFLTQLWQSLDSGKTWAQAGTNLPDDFLGLTVDTAPSNRQRVYLSGRYGPPNYLGALQRSDDLGMTWQMLPIPGADSQHLPYIGGVDPNDPDVVYVRLNADPDDSLVVSKDGGKTWTTVFSPTGQLDGFAISPDGATVAIGGPGAVPDGGASVVGNGVWTAPSSSLQFTQVSSVGALCLTWGKTGLYACADEFSSKFTAGVSHDDGKTWTPLMHLQGLCGPLACDSSSAVSQQCPAIWPATQSTISATCPSADGGTGGGSTMTASAGASSNGGPTAPAKSGCSCAVPGDGASGAALGALGALAAAWAGARSRRRATRRRR
jgi:hypothetical protein